MKKNVQSVGSLKQYETSPTVQITYDFKPGGRYVLIGDLIPKGLLGLTADATVQIMTLDEYYASKDIGAADKKWKKEHVPNFFSQAETSLNSN
jgi:hypothetical protein